MNDSLKMGIYPGQCLRQELSGGQRRAWTIRFRIGGMRDRYHGGVADTT